MRRSPAGRVITAATEQVTVALEILKKGGSLVRTLHRANKPRQALVAERCGTVDPDHGFQFLPPSCPLEPIWLASSPLMVRGRQ